MYSFKTLEISNKKYICADTGTNVKALGVLHQNRFKSSINTPQIQKDENLELHELEKKDVVQLGFTASNHSSLQIIDSELRLDTSYLFEKQSYVQDIDLAKNLIESAFDKQKGLIIFENNGEFQKHLKRKKVEFTSYSKKDIRIKLEDLSERILLDTLTLSNREQSVLASIMYFKESNKAHENLNIPVLDGSNWLYNFFVTEPSSLAQQFRVNEYSIKMLAVTLRKLYDNEIMSETHSNINDIVKKYQNGEIIVLDLPDEDKKFLKAILSYKSSSSIILIDNIYHKFSNIQYMLYDCNLFENTSKDFESFIINKYSSMLKRELIDINTYAQEIEHMHFEYLAIKKDAFPVIITNEDHIPSAVAKKTTISRTNTANFF